MAGENGWKWEWGRLVDDKRRIQKEEEKKGVEEEVNLR